MALKNSVCPPPTPGGVRHALEELLARERTAPAASDSPEQRLLERLLLTLDSAPALLGYVGRDTRYRFCNRTYSLWFGAPRHTFLGRSMAEVLGEEAFRGLRPLVEAALSGERVFFERTVPFQNGGSRRVEGMYLPHVLESGEVAGFVTLVCDVSDAHRADAAERAADSLRRSEARLRLALEATGLGIWEYVPARETYTFDARVRELLELPASEEPVPRRVALAHIHPEDRSRVEALNAQVLAPHGPRSASLEFRILGRQSGRVRWLVSYGQALLDGEGRAVGLLGTLLDVTERKRSELRAQRLRSVAEALSGALVPEAVAQVVVRESVAALEALTAELALLDADGTALEVQAEAGYPPGALDGVRRRPLDAPLPFVDVVRQRRPVLLASREEALARYPAMAGRPAMVGRSFLAVPLVAEGRALGVVGLTFAREGPAAPEDVQFLQALGYQATVALERARLFAAERAARAEAQRVVAFREELLSVVSHDLRNPLQAILTSAQALQRDAGLAPAHRRMADRIRSSADRMTRLIRELLDWARARTGGTLPIRPKPTALEEVCRQVLAEYEASHPDRQLQLTVEGDTTAELDPDRAAQVVANLVGNALTHGSPASPVRVRVQGLPDVLLLDVINQGVPIPLEARARLFEPYVRASEGGVGLGLYIVREVARAHGGQVEVRSSAEEGTCFRVTWPRRPPRGP